MGHVILTVQKGWVLPVTGLWLFLQKLPVFLIVVCDHKAQNSAQSHPEH